MEMTHRKGIKESNRNKQWTKEQISTALKMTKQNTPTPLIADRVGRTEGAVRSKLSVLGISLKPVNKSPYTKRK